MSKEGYIGRWKKYPKDEVRVARPSVLAQSKGLLNDWKEGKIDWTEYKRRFREEMLNNPKAVAKLREIKKLAEEKDVRLICYEKNPPCHRLFDRNGWELKMGSKRAVIVVSLVEESAEKSNEEIEKEIMEELSREPARIP